MNVLYLFPIFVAAVLLTAVMMIARMGMLWAIDRRVWITLTMLLALILLAA